MLKFSSQLARGNIGHHSDGSHLPAVRVGNGSLMAALDAGCARTLWPLRYTYALVKGRASSEFFFTPLVLLSFSPLLDTPSSSLSFHQVITINHDLHLL